MHDNVISVSGPGHEGCPPGPKPAVPLTWPTPYMGSSSLPNTMFPLTPSRELGSSPPPLGFHLRTRPSTGSPGRGPDIEDPLCPIPSAGRGGPGSVFQGLGVSHSTLGNHAQQPGQSAKGWLIASYPTPIYHQHSARNQQGFRGILRSFAFIICSTRFPCKILESRPGT